MWEQFLQSQWFEVALFIILLFGLAKVLHIIIISLLKHLTSFTETDADDKFIEKVKGSIFWLLIFIGIYVFRGLFFFISNQDFLRKILLTIILFFVARFFIGIFNLIVDVWGINFAEKVKSDVDSQLLRLSHGIITFILYALALIYILNIWGVEILPVLGSLGIAGLAIALALQEPLQNLFGGVQILMDRNIKVGDIIQLSSGESGLIYDITLRSTRIKTWEGKLIIIPNKIMASDKITNISLPDSKRRVDLPFGVEYGVDPDYVKAIVLEEINSIEKIEKEDPAPAVYFNDMGDNALLFEAKAWVNELSDFLPTKQEMITKIYDRLNVEGIGIPFPQRTVWFNDESKIKSKPYQKKEYKPKNKSAKETPKKSSSKKGEK